MADSVYEVWMQKLKEQLEGITCADDFKTDIGEVNRGEVSPELFKRWPAINILAAPETYANPNGGESDKLTKTCTVVLDVWIKEKEISRKHLKISNLISDVELCLYDDTARQGNYRYNLDGTAFLLIPISTVRIDENSPEEMCGFQHQFQVKYRQMCNDPTVLTA